MTTAKILGPGVVALGQYFPAAKRSNAYFKEVLGLDTSDPWIYSRTGIKNRHVAAPGEYTSDLAAHAARGALEMARMSAADLQEIIVATATPDHAFPPTSSLVQAKLDPKVHTHAFDYGNACTGGLAALEAGYSFVESGYRKNVMVIGAEILTRACDYTDRNTCVLFGDCAAAFLVAQVEDPGPYGFVMKTDGTGAEKIIFPGGVGGPYPPSVKNIEDRQFFLKMEGRAVFGSAVRGMAEVAEEVLLKTGVRKSDVTWLIPHQANDRIGEALAEKLGLKDKFISYIRNMGNVSAPSIPAAMYDGYQDGWIQPGDILLLTAIGSGYNYGAAVIQCNLPKIKDRPAGTFSDWRKRKATESQG